MDYSREKLIEIWSRAAPGEPPPALFDSLVYPGDACGVDNGRDASCGTGCGRGASFSPEPPEDPHALLRRVVEGELELTVLYSSLARFALAHPSSVRCETARSSRGVSRELMALANEELSAAKSAASAYLLASGEYYFPAPAAPRFDSLREGLRRAWRLERELAVRCAGSDLPAYCGEALRLHSAHSLALCSLLGKLFG